MNRKYTKKQICEAISYWKKRLFAIFKIDTSKTPHATYYVDDYMTTYHLTTKDCAGIWTYSNIPPQAIVEHVVVDLGSSVVAKLKSNVKSYCSSDGIQRLSTISFDELKDAVEAQAR